jgi:hypothetical protein
MPRLHLAWMPAPLGSHCSSLVPSGLVWFPQTDPELCENRNHVLNFLSIFHSSWHDSGFIGYVRKTFIEIAIAFSHVSDLSHSNSIRKGVTTPILQRKF